MEVVRPLTKRRINVETYQNRGAALEKPLDPKGTSGEMDAVVVYLDAPRSAQAADKKTAGKAVELVQRSRRFRESLLVIAAGGSVSFPNEDPIFHNVFSLSKAKAFDLGYYPQGQTRTVNFPKPGIVDVFCHLHPNMSATIVVTPTPHFARPDADGRFVLEGLSSGEHEIVAWHRAAGFFRKKVRLPMAESDGPLRFILPLRESD